MLLIFILIILSNAEIYLKNDFNLWYEKNKLLMNYLNEKFNLTKDEHFKNYYENYKFIKKFNSNNKSFKLNLKGPYSSLNSSIFYKLFNKRNFKMIKKNPNKIFLKNIPNSVDYRNYYNNIRDQKNCGGCYAFGTVGAIEGRLNIKYNNFYDLSEQEVISCSQSYGNSGCNGGMSYYSFEYIKNNNLTKEDEFSYVASTSQCKNVKKYYYIKDYFSVIDEIKEAIYRGPIDVAMDVRSSFQFYGSGYYDEYDCESDPDKLNHEMVAVGYGYNKGRLYYIIRNSWGLNWGMNGYAYVYAKVCGIDSDPVEPYEVGLI